MNKSGVAYDGGILIDHQFRTKNPSIYAAGPSTRYHRRYYADAKCLKYYDDYEVGSKLGSQIRNELDPLFKETKDLQKSAKSSMKSVSFDLSSINTSAGTESLDSKTSPESRGMEASPKVPSFKMPIVIYYTLPGGLQYLEVHPPGYKVPHQYVQSLQYNGLVLETFKGGYFKLRLTNDLIVDGITCLTPENYSLENFKHLYGMSSTVLNNVHLRYTTKKIDNFYDFFREPWAYFLYHEQTEELFAMVKELLPKGQRHGETLAEAMRSVGESLSCPSFKFDTKMKIRSRFETSPHVEAITDYVLEWLTRNDVLLPMYLQPWQTTQYDYDLNQNPVFKRRKSTYVKMLSKIF